MGEGGGGGKEDAGGELAGEDLSQRLCQEGQVLDEVKTSEKNDNLITSTVIR